MTLLILFFLSPATYAVVSLTNDFKRTDYPGKEIAAKVQVIWNKDFDKEIIDHIYGGSKDRIMEKIEDGKTIFKKRYTADFF